MRDGSMEFRSSSRIFQDREFVLLLTCMRVPLCMRHASRTPLSLQELQSKGALAVEAIQSNLERVVSQLQTCLSTLEEEGDGMYNLTCAVTKGYGHVAAADLPVYSGEKRGLYAIFDRGFDKKFDRRVWFDRVILIG